MCLRKEVSNILCIKISKSIKCLSVSILSTSFVYIQWQIHIFSCLNFTGKMPKFHILICKLSVYKRYMHQESTLTFFKRHIASEWCDILYVWLRCTKGSCFCVQTVPFPPWCHFSMFKPQYRTNNTPLLPYSLFGCQISQLHSIPYLSNYKLSMKMILQLHRNHIV